MEFETHTRFKYINGLLRKAGKSLRIISMLQTGKNQKFLTAPFPVPYGARVVHGGVHFSIFSRHADKVWVMLFDHPDDEHPVQEIELEPSVASASAPDVEVPEGLSGKAAAGVIGGSSVALFLLLLILL